MGQIDIATLSGGAARWAVSLTCWVCFSPPTCLAAESPRRLPTGSPRSARFAVSPGSLSRRLTGFGSTAMLRSMLPKRCRVRCPSAIPRTRDRNNAHPAKRDQPSAGLDQTLLETRQRPVPDPIRQRQSSRRSRDHAQAQTYFIPSEMMAEQVRQGKLRIPPHAGIHPVVLNKSCQAEASSSRTTSRPPSEVTRDP